MRLRASSLDWSIYDYIASLQWGNVSDPVLYLHAMFSLPFQISFHFWTNIVLVSSMFQLVHETDHRNPKLYRGICFPQRRYLLNLFDGVCFEKKAQPGPTSMRCGRRNFSMFGDAFQGSIVWLSQVKGNRESDILILGYVVIVMVAFLDDLCIKIQGMGSFPKADALQLESRLGTWPCNRMICAFSFPRLIYHQWWHLCQNTGKQWETRWNPSSLEANSALKGTQLQQLRTYKEARWHSKARGLKIWSWLGDLERLILANGEWMSWFPPHSTDSFAQWCWQAKSTQEPGEDMAFAEGGFLGDSLNHHEGRRVQCKV